MEKIRKSSSKVVFLAVIALVCSWAMLSNAGSLNPSAPPGPTMKTLDEVEARIPVQSLSGSGTALYTISQSGSYYLTGNITGVIDKHGIEITASDVTVDLNGYALIGPGNAVGTIGDGIYTTGLQVTVSNGSVSNWRSNGIYLFGQSSQVRNVKSTNNGGDGISVRYNSTVTDCIAVDNNGKGIAANDYSLVSKCAANENGNAGIYSGMNSVISYSTAYGNGNAGIIADDGSTVIGCTANYNNSQGIDAGTGCAVIDCIASGNSNNDGIEVDAVSTVKGCTANNNYKGIDTGNGCVVIGCNASSNSNDGIESMQSLITNNTVYNNSPNLDLSSCTASNNHAP